MVYIKSHAVLIDTIETYMILGMKTRTTPTPTPMTTPTQKKRLHTK